MNDITPALVKEMLESNTFKAMDKEFKLSFLQDAMLGF